MNCNIVTIPGDGIGPEIVREACKVLDKVGEVYGHTFQYTKILMGGCSIDEYGVPLTDEALETAKKSDAVLLGAVGGNVGNSKWYDVAPNLRPEAGLLAIRKGLNLFANLRPAYLYNELADACPLKKENIGDGFDMIIVRELTGGLYFGERHTEEVDGVLQATDTLTYNENEIRRIAIKAFDIAMKRRKHVISVDYYGTPTPIQQIASIGSPDPRQLLIQPWDASAVKLIEKAILNSDLGINPQNDGRSEEHTS